MKLALCIPLYGSVPASFFINFINRIHELYTNGKNYEVNIFIKQGQPVDYVRNELVNMALRANCDYLMFIDSDMVLPPKAIDTLIDMKVDIASGLYFSKGKPFLPVARIYQDGKHFFLEDFEFDKIMEVDGVGMGCCLIKAEIFNKVKFPWFRFEWSKWKGQLTQLAEDLYFFDQAKKAGYKVWLNTGVTCNHFGTEVEPFHFMYFKQQLLEDKLEREKLMDNFQEFEGITRDTLIKRFMKYRVYMKRETNEVDFKDLKQVENYYINNKYTIYDHLDWHMVERRAFDKHVLDTIKRTFPDKATEILDYGCNGGQVAYMLAKEGYIVTVADYNKKALDFIKFRFEKQRLKIKIIQLPVPEIRNKFDVILCFDVFEHIPDEKFKETIDLLESLKKPNTSVLTTTSFGAQDCHPSHYDFTEEKSKLIQDLCK